MRAGLTGRGSFGQSVRYAGGEMDLRICHYLSRLVRREGEREKRLRLKPYAER